MLRLRNVWAAVLGLVMCCPPAARAEVAVGEATLIKTEVTGENGPLVVKAPVHRDERIRTSIGGLGQFVFRDGTKLAVGAGSSVVIDSYVYDDATSVKKLTIKAAKGTFRWISGSSSSSAYSIVTPAGTIGVRGTAFDVYVAPNGTTAMVLLNGSAEFCGAGGCKQLRQQCDCVIASPRGGVSDPRTVDETTLRTLRNQKALPFLSGAQQLSGPLGNIRTSCGLRSIRVDRRDPERQVVPEVAPAPQRLAPPETPQNPQNPQKPQKPDKHHHHHPDRHHPDRHHHWGGPHDRHDHHWGNRRDGRDGGWGQLSGHLADRDNRRDDRHAGFGRQRDRGGRDQAGRDQAGGDRGRNGSIDRASVNAGRGDHHGHRDRSRDAQSPGQGNRTHGGQTDAPSGSSAGSGGAATSSPGGGEHTDRHHDGRRGGWNGGGRGGGDGNRGHNHRQGGG